MSNLNFPFSGPVTQSINPWDFWIKSLSSQLGFINIRNVTSSGPEIEQEVIEDVAGYGRQLGRINDVLVTLLNNLSLENLPLEQKQAVKEYREMVSEIEEIKMKWKSPTRLLSAIDTIIVELKKLKEEQAGLYEQAVSKIIKGLELKDR